MMHISRSKTISVGLAACLLWPSIAAAYGTIRFLGQDREHERITLRAFACGDQSWNIQNCIQSKTLKKLAGKKGKFGAVGHPDKKGEYRGIDAAHCDNGDHFNTADDSYPNSTQNAHDTINACRKWMSDYFIATVETAGKMIESGQFISDQVAISEDCIGLNEDEQSAKCLTLTQFGFVLHAAQDFYSHSNWSDSTSGQTIKNPPGLASETIFANLADPSLTPDIPGLLLTGCYERFPEWLGCSGRIKHAYINKDKGKIDLDEDDRVVIDEPEIGTLGEGKTNRGEIDDNFARSVKFAILDSRAHWAALETALTAKYGTDDGPRLFCAIAKDSPMTDCVD